MDQSLLDPTSLLGDALFYELAITDPDITVDRDGRVRKKIPSHISSTDVSSQLRVVAKRQPNHAGAITIVGDPWIVLGFNGRGLRRTRQACTCRCGHGLFAERPGGGDRNDRRS